MKAPRISGFVIAGAIVTIALVAGTLRKDIDGYTPSATTNNGAFRIIAVSMTHGTNHTITRGGFVTRLVDRALRQSGLRAAGAPSVRQTLSTTQDVSVLWVSYTHSNSITGAGPPWVSALLTRPDGVTELIDATPHMSDPVSNGYLSGWRLPGLVTNYSGWWFHVVSPLDGEKVMSFKL